MSEELDSAVEDGDEWAAEDGADGPGYSCEEWATLLNGVATIIR
jgi:hypothetical protein